MALDISASINAMVNARMARINESAEERELREQAYGMLSAEFNRVIADQVLEYQERINALESVPDGANKNANAIRFYQNWIDSKLQK